MGTNPLPEVAPSPIAPYWINVGGGDSVLSGIQQFDFEEIAIASAERDRKAQEEQQAKAQAMVKAGLVSALDLGASTKA